MLMIISPAKKLDFDRPVRTVLSSDPPFPEESLALIRILQRKSAAQLGALMRLSDALARLNAARYAAWVDAPTAAQARPAALAFNGDVYAGLQATQLSDAQLRWAQTHLAILSGLYGVLRPLDMIQPHRLEMGTRLRSRGAPTLYAYWSARVTDLLRARLEASGGDAVLLNLASVEYFKVVDAARLGARIVDCVFEDEKDGTWKIIGFHAKRARGLMARYVIDHRIGSVADLHGFVSEGYAFTQAQSTAERLVFRRAAVAPAAACPR